MVVSNFISVNKEKHLVIIGQITAESKSMVVMDENDLIWPLAPLTVVNMASSLTQKCTVIDCRSFLSFNSAHIRGALNVHCPPILKRRLHRGTSTLDCLLTSPESKRRLAEAETLILYEDRTQEWKELEKDNTMKIIFMLLRRERINKNVYFIKGEFCSSIIATLLSRVVQGCDIHC